MLRNFPLTRDHCPFIQYYIMVRFEIAEKVLFTLLELTKLVLAHFDYIEFVII